MLPSRQRDDREARPRPGQVVIDLNDGPNWLHGRDVSAYSPDQPRDDHGRWTPGAVDVESPAFKAWFGRSKVVDKQGRPLRVYHGTQSDFSVFDQDNPRSVSSEDQGYFFIDDPENASDHAQHDWGREDSAPNVMPVYLRIANPVVVDGIGEPSRWYDTYGPALVARAMAAGNDGVIIGNSERKLYVAFNARQIKSALTNTGRFDPNDPRVDAYSPDQLRDRSGRWTKGSDIEVPGVGTRRVVLGPWEKAPDWQLVTVDAKRFDTAWSHDDGFYLAPGGSGPNYIGDRYNGVGRFLSTSQTMRAPSVYVSRGPHRGQSDVVSATFGDGRHRFAWLRDHGVERIPVAMRREDVELAAEAGLVDRRDIAAFDPDQPRAPKGSPGGGQWTKGDTYAADGPAAPILKGARFDNIDRVVDTLRNKVVSATTPLAERADRFKRFDEAYAKALTVMHEMPLVHMTDPATAVEIWKSGLRSKASIYAEAAERIKKIEEDGVKEGEWDELHRLKDEMRSGHTFKGDIQHGLDRFAFTSFAGGNGNYGPVGVIFDNSILKESWATPDDILSYGGASQDMVSDDAAEKYRSEMVRGDDIVKLAAAQAAVQAVQSSEGPLGEIGGFMVAHGFGPEVKTVYIPPSAIKGFYVRYNTTGKAISDLVAAGVPRDMIHELPTGLKTGGNESMAQQAMLRYVQSGKRLDLPLPNVKHDGKEWIEDPGVYRQLERYMEKPRGNE